MNATPLLRHSIALLLFTFAPHAGRADTELSAREAAYAAAVAKIEQPQRELLENYRESLRSLGERKQAAGDLEAVIAVNREIETAAKQEKRDLEAQPELKRLREIYETTLSSLMTEAAAEQNRLRHSYRTRLAAAVEALTREGNIEEALAINARIKELDAAAPLMGGEKEGKVLWEWSGRASVEAVGECKFKTVPNGYVLSSDRGGGGAWMQSRQEFTPPFRIKARAATDSTNLRFYYKDLLAILNWEVNPSDLRIHHPATGQKLGVRGMGNIAVNEMHDIDIDVLVDKVVVRVNGEVRGELSGNATTNNSGLEAPVGIGPAVGSIVTLESMRVVALE